MPQTALVLLDDPVIDSRFEGVGASRDYRFADPSAAQVNVLDFGVTRGDGIFETISVGAGRLQALEPHLARFARSAALLDLPAPDLDAWREAIAAAAGAIDPAPEAFVKTVMTRGVEGSGGDVTGWAYASPSADFAEVRREGIAVVTLDRGYRHDIAKTSPWLLAGAKTLSYAVNRAVLREAAKRGAEDAVFVSSDGYLLEGSTSNLILRVGDRLVTPSLDLGILAGTTQNDIFGFAAGIGLRGEYALLEQSALADADAAWLVSSVRHAAPIRSVDGVERPVDAELTAAINTFLIGRRV